MLGGSQESQSTRCVTLTPLVVFTKQRTPPPQAGSALVVRMGLWPVNSALCHLTEAPASEIKPNGSTQEVPDDEGSILPADYIPGNQVSPQSQCRLNSQSLNDHYHGDLLAAVSVVL